MKVSSRMVKNNSSYRLETNLIHAGDPLPRIDGAVIQPIFQSVMYETAGETHYNAVRYVRLNNTPNQISLQEKIAVLEHAESALVTASGMAAIVGVLLTTLRAGDHLLVQNCLYGGTHTFITHDFSSLGLSYDFIDPHHSATWQAKLQSHTKAIYVEAMANPLLQVGDLKAVVAFAKAHGLLSIIDNTFATPINFCPIDLGFDVSLHSATKYLNGHSDVVAGAVAGRAEFIERLNHKMGHLGGCLDPHAAFLLQRGLKTLALRVRYQNASAGKIAEFLQHHPSIKQVNYPGLTSSRDYRRAQELFHGCGGVLSFELEGGAVAAEHFLKKQHIAVQAPSLGGVETLITRPATTSHVGMSAEERRQIGISDGLIRLSVGIEATEDLIEDFNQALRG